MRNIYGKRKGSKMGNKSATSNNMQELAGRRFDSRLERDRAELLVLLQRGKEIRNLRFQEKVYLTKAEIGYRADFYYEERYAPRKFRKIWEDTKGFETPRWRLIKRLWKHYGPGALRVTVRTRDGKIKTKEEIIPND